MGWHYVGVPVSSALSSDFFLVSRDSISSMMAGSVPVVNIRLELITTWLVTNYLIIIMHLRKGYVCVPCTPHGTHDTAC